MVVKEAARAPPRAAGDARPGDRVVVAVEPPSQSGRAPIFSRIFTKAEDARILFGRSRADESVGVATIKIARHGRCRRVPGRPWDGRRGKAAHWLRDKILPRIHDADFGAASIADSAWEGRGAQFPEEIEGRGDGKRDVNQVRILQGCERDRRRRLRQVRHKVWPSRATSRGPSR